MAIRHLKDLDNGVEFEYESNEVDENVYSPTNEKESIEEKKSDDNETKFKQNSNVVQTIIERCSNDVQTITKRDSNVFLTKNQVQTYNANKAKGEIPPTTYKEVVEQNKVIVNLINKRGFLKKNTKYRNLSTLPINAPKELVAVFNKEGVNINQYELTKILTAMKIERKYEPFTVYFIFFIGIAITLFISYKFPIKVSEMQIDSKFESMLTTYETEKQFTFYPYRKEQIRKEYKNTMNVDEFFKLLEKHKQIQQDVINNK